MSDVILFFLIAACIALVFYAGYTHGKRAQIEIYYRGLLKIVKATKTQLDEQEYIGDCAGQNCHACANPCDKYIESLR